MKRLGIAFVLGITMATVAVPASSTFASDINSGTTPSNDQTTTTFDPSTPANEPTNPDQLTVSDKSKKKHKYINGVSKTHKASIKSNITGTHITQKIWISRSGLKQISKILGVLKGLSDQLDKIEITRALSDVTIEGYKFDAEHAKGGIYFTLHADKWLGDRQFMYTATNVHYQ